MQYTIHNLHLLDNLSLMDLQNIAIRLKVPTRYPESRTFKDKSQLRADIKTKIIILTLKDEEQNN